MTAKHIGARHREAWRIVYLPFYGRERTHHLTITFDSAAI